MKIQDQPPIYFKKSLQTNDEYYWKNQQQLEDSALSFQDFIRGNKKELDSSSAQTDLPTQVDSDSSLAMREVKKEASNPTELATQIITIETLANEVYRQASQQLLENPVSNFQPALKDLSPSLTSAKRSLPKQVTATQENSNLKNYQLFILNNQAELSINTSQLDNQQTKELRQLIKQWLVNKGVRLQQLIINGVKQ
ncbi:hypothetical protein [Legionella drozanskii]|uniref:Uncharacterized protein n=1 Tax=Legionella drozanskii LLAP-1 TaxID=1212489 RepID=A0A0W0SXU4_9GAMM|nr:hypothetical protein [Legionella drozanskii]KTC87765.1 hypothetical protein Ldro_1384 [Legionella drozanskii LLAP-1]